MYAHNGDRKAALDNFTLALERDPKMATGYVNRGFVLNDLRQAEKAAQDFQTALKLQPDYGQAHLGLAYADLQLRRPKPALTHLDTAQKILGNSRPLHLARAEAFRQEQDFHTLRVNIGSHCPKIRTICRPNWRMPIRCTACGTTTKPPRHEYSDRLSPSDSSIYALRAQIYAKQGKRNEALRRHRIRRNALVETRSRPSPPPAMHF